jgi:two-component system, OmpR family, response regulator
MSVEISKPIHILLIEDDLNLGFLMVENLDAKGIKTTHAKTGKEGIAEIVKGDFDLCILDVMLPEVDGFALATRLRSSHPSIPFIFVTARLQDIDKINGFELGADDYVTKPFSFKELYYRIMVILKRRNNNILQQEPKEIAVGNIKLNNQERVLTVNGSDKKLSRREAALLSKLMQNWDNFVTRSEILKQIWGADDFFTAKSMDVYINRIRKLLKDEPSILIENLYGSGYKIGYSKKQP